MEGIRKSAKNEKITMKIISYIRNHIEFDKAIREEQKIEGAYSQEEIYNRIDDKLNSLIQKSLSCVTIGTFTSKSRHKLYSLAIGEIEVCSERLIIVYLKFTGFIFF